MGKEYILSLSPEDRRTFDRWLKGNAVVGAIFVAALVAMSVLGSQAGTPPDRALASGAGTTIVASVTLK